MHATLRCRPLLALGCAALLSAAVNLVAGPAQAAPAVVTRVAAVETSQNVELSVVASAPIRYELRAVQPNWIVIDVSPATLAIPAGVVPFAGHMVTKIRVGQFQSTVVRVVVEMARPAPFRVTPSTDGTALLVGIGPGAPLTSTAGPGSTDVAASKAIPPQPATIPFKSTAAAPQGSQQPTAQPTATQPQAAPPQASHPPVPQSQAPPAERFQSVVPGKAVGPVRLGMRVQDIVPILGQPLRKQTLPDGNMVYQWFAPPSNSGLGVRVTPGGVVFRAWVVNDPQYAIQDRVHVGTTEAGVRAALGNPSQVVDDAQQGLRTLTYPSLGLWIIIQTDPRYAFYGQVFEIGVTAASLAAR